MRARALRTWRGMRFELGFACLLLALANVAASAIETSNGEACVSLADECIEARLAAARELMRSSDPEQARPTLEQLTEQIHTAPSDDAPANLRARLELHYSLLDYIDEDMEAMNVRADRALALTEGYSGLDRADALGTKALYFSTMGRPADSLEWLEQELAQRRLLPPPASKMSSTLVNLGITYAETGRFSLAEERLEEALAFALEYDTDTSIPDLVRNNLGYVYGSRNEYARAAEVYQDVADRYREIRANTPALSNVLSNLGQMWLSLGRLDDAKRVLDEAYLIQKATQPTSVGMSRILVALGRVHAGQGDVANAWELTIRAMTLVDELAPDSIFTVIVRRSLARIAFLHSDSTDAQRVRAQRELASVEPLSSALLPLSAERVQVLYLLGKAAHASGDSSVAIRRYEEAISVLDAQYSLVGDDLLAEAEFADAFEDLYKSLAILHAQQERALSAIRVLESYRQRAAIAPLQLDEALASDYQAREQIRDQVAQLLAQQATADASGRLAAVADIERELDRLLKLDQELIASAVARNPGLTPLLLPSGDVDSVSRRLQSGQRLVYFALAQPQSLAIVLASDASPNIVWLKTREELVAAMDSLRAFVADAGSDIEHLQSVSAKAHELLIAPLGESLSDANELVIVPDGELYLTPFAALFDAQEKRYLVSRFQIKQLANLSEWPIESRPRSLAFAGFAYASSEGVPGLRDQVLAALPFAEQEVRAAASRFSGSAEVFLDTAATPGAMKAISADIVHVASHAVLDPSNPAASFMALAPNAEADDGRLTFADIAAARQMSASLVVLSACETALGPVFGGEGIISLARAFGAAGARSTIASLWAVADRSSAQLMSRFYLYLSNGESRSRALALAQRDLLADDEGWFDTLTRATGVAPDYRHPYYWSAFVLTDNGLPATPAE